MDKATNFTGQCPNGHYIAQPINGEWEVDTYRYVKCLECDRFAMLSASGRRSKGRVHTEEIIASFDPGPVSEDAIQRFLQERYEEVSRQLYATVRNRNGVPLLPVNVERRPSTEGTGEEVVWRLDYSTE